MSRLNQKYLDSRRRQGLDLRTDSCQDHQLLNFGILHTTDSSYCVRREDGLAHLFVVVRQAHLLAVATTGPYTSNGTLAACSVVFRKSIASSECGSSGSSSRPTTSTSAAWCEVAFLLNTWRAAAPTTTTICASTGCGGGSGSRRGSCLGR